MPSRRVPPEWISFREARRRLAIGPDAFAALVDAGRLTVRRVPGSWGRVLAVEVDRLAVECTTAAQAS